MFLQAATDTKKTGKRFLLLKIYQIRVHIRLVSIDFGCTQYCFLKDKHASIVLQNFPFNVFCKVTSFLILIIPYKVQWYQKIATLKCSWHIETLWNADM